MNPRHLQTTFGESLCSILCIFWLFISVWHFCVWNNSRQQRNTLEKKAFTLVCFFFFFSCNILVDPWKYILTWSLQKLSSNWEGTLNCDTTTIITAGLKCVLFEFKNRVMASAFSLRKLKKYDASDSKHQHQLFTQERTASLSSDFIFTMESKHHTKVTKDLFGTSLQMHRESMHKRLHRQLVWW